MNKKRVLVAMSGGVDSSVAAYILKEEGYDVIGVTMQIWPDDNSESAGERSCCSLSAVGDARRVAETIGIPFYVMNFKDIFEKKVISYFVEEYLIGRTPNPCIACNRFIKFEELLRRASQIDAFYIATGHYANVMWNKELGRFLLKRSKDNLKDQTYALYSMNQHQLEHTLLPLGNYTKMQIRTIAEKIGLAVASKPDSQEICFVQDDNYGRFIKERTNDGLVSGNFTDINGNILGRHKGIPHYTIGQRKGLGISSDRPLYVIKIDTIRNAVVLGEEEQVYSSEMRVIDLNSIFYPKMDKCFNATVKVRYGNKEFPALIEPMSDNEVSVKFDYPVRAITPGQTAVFYNEDFVLGGGTIESSFNY